MSIQYNLHNRDLVPYTYSNSATSILNILHTNQFVGVPPQDFLYEMHMVHYCHNYQKLFKQCRTQPRRDGTASGPATRELEAYFPLIRAFRRRASDARSMLEFARCKAIPIEITKSRFGSGLRQGQ